MEHQAVKNLQSMFGKRVKQLRKEQGYSQNEFAVAADITQAYLSRVERGLANPQLDNIEKIASCLGISLSELFTFDTENLAPIELRAEEKVQRLISAIQSLPINSTVEIYDSLSHQIKRK